MVLSGLYSVVNRIHNHLYFEVLIPHFAIHMQVAMAFEPPASVWTLKSDIVPAYFLLRKNCAISVASAVVILFAIICFVLVVYLESKVTQSFRTRQSFRIFIFAIARFPPYSSA